MEETDDAAATVPFVRRFPVKLSSRRGVVLLLSLVLALAASVLAGCGGGTKLLGGGPPPDIPGSGGSGSSNIGSSGGTTTVLAGGTIATKNTTRFGGSDAADDAAAVALGVFPSASPGTHPTAVTLVPADNWQAALAASVLSGAPVRAPILISRAQGLPAASVRALQALAPTGAGSIGGAQVLRVGDAVGGSNLRTASISGTGPYALAAAIDRFSAAAHGGASPNVIIASGDDSAYAGHHPAGDADVLARLAAARAAGAEYLAVPSPSAWWLDFYPALARYLTAGLVAEAPDTVTVYRLGELP